MTVMEWWNGLNYRERRRVLSDEGGQFRKKIHGQMPPKWMNLGGSQRDLAASRYGKPLPLKAPRKGEAHYYPPIRKRKYEVVPKLTKQEESDLRVERMVDLAFVRVA
jgi:hypothetical protein